MSCYSLTGRTKRAREAIARATRGVCLTQNGAQQLARALRRQGLRVDVEGSVGLGSGRGGAAANRGKYRPLPPGQSAIEQHREVQAARDRIIAAIESGEWELCRKNRPTPASAPSGPPGSHGNRTASEIEAVRKRFEKAGF